MKTPVKSGTDLVWKGQDKTLERQMVEGIMGQWGSVKAAEEGSDLFKVMSAES